MNRANALVTGASSGIGAATARRLAKEQYNVCINARRGDLLDALVRDLPAGEHFSVGGDYSSLETQQRLARVISERWGSLDLLVNCAGIAMSHGILDGSLEEWRKPFDMMFDGAVGVVRAVAPLVTSGGRIIHVTSIHGRRAERGSSAYAMAKAALNQYCRSLALELADRNILVNAVAPGFVDTPMSISGGVNELKTDWFKQNYVDGDHLPLKRPAQPEEIAGVIAFLAGPDASYITGQVLVVDGGLTITF